MNDFKTAVTHYKLESGDKFVRPVKANSHFIHGGWYLLKGTHENNGKKALPRKIARG